MEQTAIVKRVFPSGVAEVALMRQVECGLNCKSCEGCSQRAEEELLAMADNAEGVAVGDIVTVRPRTGGRLGAAILVCLLPCFGLIAGYLIGELLRRSQGVCILLAFVGLAAGFVPAVLANRTAARTNKPEFSVVATGR
ncbi:MAG: SoxR reducing system RseC family protein [Oscillospiraceae bacterium]|nr:SoxR reducing system RseC family protein [Oscillospiraceae bacterium]